MVSKVGIGAQALPAEAMFQVTNADCEISIDESVLESLTKAYRPFSKTPVTKESLPESGGIVLPVPILRAAVALRISQIVRGKSGVSPTLLTALIQMLNSNKVPEICVKNVDDSLFALVCAVAGFGSVSGWTAVEITMDDAQQFSTNSSALFSAVVMASVQTLKFCIPLEDFVAGLALDLSKASTVSFKNDHVDVSHPHRSMVRVAGNIRLLTESSKLVNTKKTTDPACLRNYHEVAAALIDSVDSASKFVRTDLTCFDSAPVLSGPKNQGPPSMDLSKWHISCLLSSTKNAALACKEGAEYALKEMEGATIDPLLQAFSVFESLSSCTSIALFQAATAFLEVLKAAVAFYDDYATVTEAALLEKQMAVDAAKAKARAEAEAKFGNNKKAKKAKKEKAPKTKGGLGFGQANALFRSKLIEHKSNLSPMNREFSEWMTSTLAAASEMRKPKVAKGCRDYVPAQTALRQKIFGTIQDVFARHGAVTIETPVFELREALTGKYGEDSKLIYDLADQGGENLSLRYDLTVPFARFVAQHGIKNIKRYHIAKVYRRDQPAMTKGRYREFYQCDFDIAGDYETMIPDAEVIKVMCDILSALPIGGFKVKLNHRVLLDSMMEICGVPGHKFRTICSAIDKLDKEPWSAVRAEMVDEKGLAPEVADRIEPFVALSGSGFDLLERLEKVGHFSGHAKATAALEEMRLLFTYLKAFGALELVSFDLSLARGLDYYTGVIYEAVLTSNDSVGSIAAGGRYDKLVGMFSGKDIPAVGVSVGIERVYTIIERKLQEAKSSMRENDTQVFVCANTSDENGYLPERMELANTLWKAGIKAEFMYQANPKLGKQLKACGNADVPVAVIFGQRKMMEGDEEEEDLGEGVVPVYVRDMVNNAQKKVKAEDVVEAVQSFLPRSLDLDEMFRSLKL
eukprot:TRINITY_DN5191_c0_g1_i1.p1 TRINITY_DN5191_c0_g1~~TRINITY_DN5191_c0_g1_i1.p1  ORF type:complete len:931 (+),score=292.10 TRINITY_DN5191_c0_g1_i1:47-2794(+)